MNLLVASLQPTLLIQLYEFLKNNMATRVAHDKPRPGSLVCVAVFGSGVAVVTPLLRLRLPRRPGRAAFGGGERDRTDDPLLAKQVLSQLSYTPRDLQAWWAWLDSNQRPPPYQDDALTN